jgi:hypothetical protein
MFDEMEQMIEVGLAIGAIAITGYVLMRRIWSKRVRGRYWTGSSVGNALQQLQGIARPGIEYQMVEKLTRRREDDDSGGGPDDPASYGRRLRENVDQRVGEKRAGGES